MGAYSAVVLDTGDTANLVFSKWLDPYNSVLGKWAVAPADPFPARVRSKFVGRSLGKARFSADVPAFLPRLAGVRGIFAAFLPEAATAAVLRTGALESPSGQRDFDRTAKSLS